MLDYQRYINDIKRDIDSLKDQLKHLAEIVGRMNIGSLREEGIENMKSTNQSEWLTDGFSLCIISNSIISVKI